MESNGSTLDVCGARDAFINVLITHTLEGATAQKDATGKWTDEQVPQRSQLARGSEGG